MKRQTETAPNTQYAEQRTTGGQSPVSSRREERQPVIEQPSSYFTAYDESVQAYMWQMAGALVTAGTIPKSYKELANPVSGVFVAVMAGKELGLGPAASVQAFAIINGVPYIWGDHLAGIVYASGKFDHDRYSYRFEGEGLAFRCVVTMARMGSTAVHEYDYSLQDAKTGELWTDVEGGKCKDSWMKNPRRMLFARAHHFGYKKLFSEVVTGLPIATKTGDPADAVDLEHTAEDLQQMASRAQAAMEAIKAIEAIAIPGMPQHPKPKGEEDLQPAGIDPGDVEAPETGD